MLTFMIDGFWPVYVLTRTRVDVCSRCNPVS